MVLAEERGLQYVRDGNNRFPLTKYIKFLQNNSRRIETYTLQICTFFLTTTVTDQPEFDVPDRLH